MLKARGKLGVALIEPESGARHATKDQHTDRV
jgi:hypothetical protein